MSEPGASLYNRHRPATFADMVGQDHVARALGNALRSGRPAQGYLFSGPRGTGQDHDGAHPGALPQLPVEPGPHGRAVRHLRLVPAHRPPGLAGRGRGGRRLERPPHRRDARVARDRPLRAGGVPLPHHDHGRGPPDPGPGRQRPAEDARGAAAAPGGDPLHHAPLGHPGHDPLAPAALRAAQAGPPGAGEGARPGGARRGHRDLRGGARHPRPRGRRLVPRRARACSTRSRPTPTAASTPPTRSSCSAPWRARRSSSWST